MVMGEMWKYRELHLYLILRTTSALNRTSTYLLKLRSIK
jgi:hypothetical protein